MRVDLLSVLPINFNIQRLTDAIPLAFAFKDNAVDDDEGNQSETKGNKYSGCN